MSPADLGVVTVDQVVAGYSPPPGYRLERLENRAGWLVVKDGWRDVFAPITFKRPTVKADSRVKADEFFYMVEAAMVPQRSFSTEYIMTKPKTSGCIWKVGDRVGCEWLRAFGTVVETRDGACAVLWDGSAVESFHPDHTLYGARETIVYRDVKPQNHCQHCGTGIYEGLLERSCPKGCDLTVAKALPEPKVVMVTRDFGTQPGIDGSVWFNRPGGRADGDEVYYQAYDHRASAVHPTREGAVALWREKVSR